MSEFDKMAIKREFETKEISEDDIWKASFNQISQLDIDPETKADMITSSIPSSSFVFQQLEQQQEQSIITEEDFNKLFEACLAEF